MVKIKTIVYTSKFEHDVKKARDRLTRDWLEKQVRRIADDPEVGKPLNYALKGERTVRISSHRLIYAVDRDRLILLRFEHRKEVYE